MKTASFIGKLECDDLCEESKRWRRFSQQEGGSGKAIMILNVTPPAIRANAEPPVCPSRGAHAGKPLTLQTQSINTDRHQLCWLTGKHTYSRAQVSYRVGQKLLKYWICNISGSQHFKSYANDAAFVHFCFHIDTFLVSKLLFLMFHRIWPPNIFSLNILVEKGFLVHAPLFDAITFIVISAICITSLFL